MINLKNLIVSDVPCAEIKEEEPRMDDGSCYDIESTKKYTLAMVLSGALVLIGTISMIVLYTHSVLFFE